MKNALNYVFNTLRNISLFIIITVIFIFAFVLLTKKAESHLLTYLLAPKEPILLNSGDEVMSIATVDEELPLPVNSKKIKIAIRSGFSYLRPTQIMYIYAGKPVVITTVDGEQIEVSASLTEIEQLLKKDPLGNFFRTKSALINCNYILKLSNVSSRYKEEYQYQHKVLMEDKSEIPLSKNKADLLFEILDDLSF